MPDANYQYIDPVPNATARNWGGQQGRAAGMTGSLNSKNVGADLGAPRKSPLFSPVSGKVVRVFRGKYTGAETGAARKEAVNENYGWGTSILIQGDDGYFHRLSHLEPGSAVPYDGDRVEAGQQVGQVGQSGNTMGSGEGGGYSHLDWEKFTTPNNDPFNTKRNFVNPTEGRFEGGGQQFGAKARGASFPGEFDTRPGLNREAMSPAMRQWAGLIEEKADKYGIPPNLLAGIIDYESGGKADAGHPTSGATGLGQVMPKGSGPWFNDRPTREQLLDPETNLEWSAKILAANYKRYNNNPQSAAAAYLGAVDAKGNPTTAADANGTNGFKYVQEVMGRAEKFSGTDPRTSQASAAQAAQQQEQAMATDLQGVIGGYNTTLQGVRDTLAARQNELKALQQQHNADLATQTKVLAIPQKDQTPQQKAELAAAVMRLNSSTPRVKELEAAIQSERDNERQTLDSLQVALKSASGQELTAAEKSKLEADANQSNAAAEKARAELARYKPGDPGYDEAKAKADLTRSQADNYTRTLDFEDRKLGQQDRALGQTDRRIGLEERGLGQTDRRIALEEYEKYNLTPANVQRIAAATGLDNAQAKALLEKLQPELKRIAAETSYIQDQGAYQRAITERVNALIAPELEQAVQTGRLTKAQADKAIGTLGSDIALAEQNVRQSQAGTGLTQAQTWAQMVTANKAEFDAQMQAMEAETWKAVQRVAANPNASDEDIMGAIQAGARNATEAAQVYQTKINQFNAQETARHQKVAEGIDIQRADEEERNNRYNNLASIQNARANMQNASTQAVGPRLGATGMANAMAGLGMVVGSEGLNRLGMQSGTGASVINPVKEGLAPFEKDQATLRAGVRDNRLADPNATGTQFKAPRPNSSIAAGVANQNVPTYTPIQRPTVEGVTFQAPQNGAATNPDQAMVNIALNPAEAAPSTAVEEPPPAPEPPPPPEEEEEEGGGGGKGPKGPKVVFAFKPPKAKKPTKVAVVKKGGGGSDGSCFRVPMPKRKAA